MQAPLRDRDPRRLGPYRLLGRLGRGGMGTVFLGEDDSGRQVAVKVINAELADDEAFNERFRSEVTAARQVRRFCTAAVLDARLDGEPLYVVTEYVSGPSLDAAVRDGGPLRGGDLEALAVNIATALSAIHGAGIVHRDLKPSNVLLSPTGPRVIDFGIARALDASDGPTRTGQFIGTPSYMAPELMNGAEITPAADVFAWGCVVAYAGTGRAPFGAGTLPETINRVTAGEPDLDGLDPSLRDLVTRSLAKDPAERPAVRQLIQALTGQEEPPSTAPAVALPVPLPTADEPEAAAEPETTLEPAAPEQAAPAPVTAFESVPATRPVNAPPPAAAQTPPTQPPFPPSPSPASPKPPRPPRSRHRLGLAIGAVATVAGVSALFGVLNLTSDGGGEASGPPAAQAAAGLGKEPPEVEDKVFEDNFSDETSGWKTAATPTWDASYRDRKYELHVLPTTTRTTVDAPADDIPDSQLIEVKVELKEGEGGEAGVYCHGQGSGFAFLLREDGRARIARMDGSTLTDLATGTAADMRSHDDRIQAACAEDGSRVSLDMWVNGEHVASAAAEAPDEDPGSSGLIAHRPEGTEGHPEATFDNFALCSV
ncbi:serine/threonine-protein kinase [Actinomadura sp. 7K507]|uniref:serine/threonine-protein kinase n=1 Tax=Actinomadura sp. 7K507 TaxID=2530365 RepID=UPI001A9F9F36|nr:serine/threonine-protein kinase [Actinomadura sp. 7K507]